MQVIRGRSTWESHAGVLLQAGEFLTNVNSLRKYARQGTMSIQHGSTNAQPIALEYQLDMLTPSSSLSFSLSLAVSLFHIFHSPLTA